MKKHLEFWTLPYVEPNTPLAGKARVLIPTDQRVLGGGRTARRRDDDSCRQTCRCQPQHRVSCVSMPTCQIDRALKMWLGACTRPLLHGCVPIVPLRTQHMVLPRTEDWPWNALERGVDMYKRRGAINCWEICLMCGICLKSLQVQATSDPSCRSIRHVSYAANEHARNIKTVAHVDSRSRRYGPEGSCRRASRPWCGGGVRSRYRHEPKRRCFIQKERVRRTWLDLGGLEARRVCGQQFCAYNAKKESIISIHFHRNHS